MGQKNVREAQKPHHKTLLSPVSLGLLSCFTSMTMKAPFPTCHAGAQEDHHKLECSPLGLCPSEAIQFQRPPGQGELRSNHTVLCKNLIGQGIISSVIPLPFPQPAVESYGQGLRALEPDSPGYSL